MFGLIQSSQTGDQLYSDTSPYKISECSWIIRPVQPSFPKYHKILIILSQSSFEGQFTRSFRPLLVIELAISLYRLHVRLGLLMLFIMRGHCIVYFDVFCLFCYEFNYLILLHPYAFTGESQCDQIGRFFNFGQLFKAFGNN